jgi:beta-lactamase superfamily II metal-dependent hydrolase
MKLQIFDVEHGACALLTADNGTRFMIDCGHNASTSWQPGSYLRQEGVSTLEMLAITNYDEDHASGSNNLFDSVSVGWLWRNKSVSGATLKSLKSEDGMGSGIERLVHEIEHTYTGGGVGGTTPQPTFQGLDQRLAFYNSYPAFDDENNLSMAIFLKCHGIGVMFTGDLERAGFAELLKNDSFRQALQSANVYVASHHGRESGCSAEVASLLSSAFYVVISDKGYVHDTQRTLPFYRQIAKSGPFRGDTRRVLTTRRDGRIGFNFAQGSWGPY